MAHTVLDQVTREQYTAFIGETDFSYAWKIFEDNNLRVYATPNGQIPDPVIDIQILGVDYIVTGAGNPNGGEVQFIVPRAAGDIITIELWIPPDRLFDYSVGGTFKGESINLQLDKLTKLVQQNQGINENRQLTYKVTDILTDGDVTLPYLGINQFWMKNASGGLVNVTLEQNPDWSTLRTELLNDQSGTAGSKIVGHYSTINSSTTVSDELEAIQAHIKPGSTYYGVTATSPIDYTTTIADFPTSYLLGITLELRIHATNTGAVRINVNGLGFKNLKLSDGAEFEAGGLETDSIYVFIYNGASFRLNGTSKATYVYNGTVNLEQTTRAFATVTGSTAAIVNGYNVTSVAKTGTGTYDVTLAFTTIIDYSPFISVDIPLTAAPDNRAFYGITAKASNVFSIAFYDANGVARDPTLFYITVNGNVA